MRGLKTKGSAWNNMKRLNVLKNCRNKSSSPTRSVLHCNCFLLIHANLQDAVLNVNVLRCNTIFYVTSSTWLTDRGTSKQTLSRPYNRLTHLSQIWFVLTWLSACCQNPMWGLILTCTWDVLLKALRLCPRLQYSSVKRPRFMHHKRLLMYHKSITFEVSAEERGTGLVLTCAKNLAFWIVFTTSLT